VAAGRTRRFDERDRRALHELLRAVVVSGTGRAASLSGPAYGKTGTSQEYRDAWFVGFTNELVVGVWMGNDDNTPMRRAAGGGLPARMWREFMAASGAGRAVAPEPMFTEDEFPSEADIVTEGGPAEVAEGPPAPGDVPDDLQTELPAAVRPEIEEEGDPPAEEFEAGEAEEPGA
jgi:penicillin-binding protein 1A